MSGVSIATGVIATDALGGGAGRGLQSGGVLTQVATGTPVTGTTNETTLATIVIPGGMMSINGKIRIRAKWTFTASAGTKNMRVKYGGTTLGRLDNGGSATAVSAQVWWDIDFRTLSSQYGNPDFTTGIAGATANAVLTAAIDSTVNQNLILTGQLGSGTDTLTLETYTIEILNV